jgi:hypothetical protein
MATAEGLVKVALRELQSGVSGTPNRYTRWYGLNGNWCAMFVSYCCNDAGISTDIVPKTAAVQTLLDFAKAKGRFKAVSSGYRPQGGDIMIQKSNGASHTGIVIASSGTSFTTVEGNSSNRVRKRSYTLSSSVLTGFFVPDYDGKGNRITNSASADGTKSEVCSVSVVAVTDNGSGSSKRARTELSDGSGEIELHIVNAGTDYQPIVVGEMRWITKISDSAGRLEFTLLKDSLLDILEGNTVVFRFKGEVLFYGYLFEKKRTKDGLIHCVAYDGLRYFKNRVTMCYSDLSYSELIAMLCKEYGFEAGEIEDTGYKIPYRLEDNATLFEICAEARELTSGATGAYYVLYDSNGKLCLKSVDSLATDYLVCDTTARDYYSLTSIDDGVYNLLAVYSDDEATGERRTFVYKDSDTISSWGELRRTRTLKQGEDPYSLQGELDRYNKKKRVLKLNGCFGDSALRGGSTVRVSLDVGDIVYNEAEFVVTEAVHRFYRGYSCDLVVEQK